MKAPIMLTTSVIPKRTKAAYIKIPTSLCCASGKVLASNAARVLAGEKSERLIVLALPHKHGQRHGLSQGAAKGQENSAHDSAGGGGQNHGKNCLPGRCAQSISGHAQFGGHRNQRVPADGGDGGQDHDRQDDHSGENAGTTEVGAKGANQPIFRCSQLQAGRISGMMTNNPHKP